MQYTFSELNEESLRKLYCEYFLRAREIGKIIGVTESAILLRLKKYGIPATPKGVSRKEIDIEYTGKDFKRKKALTQDVLVELYGKGLSDKDIGRLFGLSENGVSCRRAKYSIESRTPEGNRVALNHMRGLKDITELTRDELINELQAARSIKEIARKYSSTFSTVKDLISGHGLDRDKVLADHITLSDIQKKVIIGGLLGDGGVYDGGIRGYYYREGHCVEQLEYLKWKAEILKDMIVDDLYYDRRKSLLGTDTVVVGFRTAKYAELGAFRDLFYKQVGDKWVKIIPGDIIQSLDAFVFSIWYFDDGGIRDGDKLPYVCSGAPKHYLDEAVGILNERFGLDAFVDAVGTVGLIVFRNGPAFFNLIKNHIPSNFYYKIPVEFRFDIPGLDADTAKLSSLFKSYNPEKWRTLPKDEQSVWVDNVVKYYSFIGFPFYHIKRKSDIESIIGKLRAMDIRQEVLDKGAFFRVNPIGSDLASSYFPHMWAARIRGKRSVYNNYEDSSQFRKVIENVFRYRRVLTEASIRSELRHGSTAQNFKPLIAKTIYDLYCPEGGTVFDYSAGYGGRMFGAAVSDKVSKYIGTDPCQQTFYGLRKLARKLERYCLGKEFQVFNMCSEDPSWYPDVPVDVCFSSPPYFDAERYSDEPTQSYKKYPDIKTWIDMFLFKTIENCYRILKDGGYFIINIADTGRYGLQCPAFEKLSELLSFERFFIIRMPSYFNAQGKYEPVFVFKKCAGAGIGYGAVKAQMDAVFGQMPVEEEELARIRNVKQK